MSPLTLKNTSSVDVASSQEQVDFIEDKLTQTKEFPRLATAFSKDSAIIEVFEKEPEEKNQSDLNGSWPYLNKVPDNMSEVCFDFCNIQGLSGAVEECLSKVKEFFDDSIEHLFAELDCFVDDEPEDIGHIVVRLVVSCDEQVAEEREDLWDTWFVSNINDYARSKIVLDIDRG